MRVHLTVDFVASALLAVAPFLFGYSNLGLNVWLPQVAAGVAVILLVLVSKTEPQESTWGGLRTFDLPALSKRYVVRGRSS